MVSSSALVPGGASAAGRREVAALTSCHRRPESAGKVFSTRARGSSAPRGRGFGSSGAGGAEMSPRSLEERSRSGGAGPHKLAPGLPAPPPPRGPRLPGLSPFLLPPLPPPRQGREAPCARRRADRAGVASELAAPCRPLLPPAAPSSPLPEPRCAGRAQGAGGDGARRRKRRARRGPSPERSPLQLQPQVPSLPPSRPANAEMAAAATKEAPVLQRHSAFLTARH